MTCQGRAWEGERDAVGHVWASGEVRINKKGRRGIGLFAEAVEFSETCYLSPILASQLTEPEPVFGGSPKCTRSPDVLS